MQVPLQSVHSLEPLHASLFCVLNLMFCGHGYWSQLKWGQPELTKEDLNGKLTPRFTAGKSVTNKPSSFQREIPHLMIKTPQLSVLLLIKTCEITQSILFLVFPSHSAFFLTFPCHVFFCW